MKLILLLMTVTMTTGVMFGEDEELIAEPVGDVDPECLAKADALDCEFYNCFTRRFPCAQGFLVRGLYPTCERMTGRKLELNQQGQTWLSASRRCFHNHLKVYYQMDVLPCDGFKEDAINFYTSCAGSVTPNMCEIFYENRGVITQVLNISPEQIVDNPRTALRNLFGLGRMMAGCARDEVKSFLRSLTSSIRSSFRFPWD